MLPRLNAGLPPCTNVAVFRIEKYSHSYVSTSYCCWECIPDDQDDIPFYEAAGV
ncbi:hypothetical protein ACTXG6_06010 [Pseudonocardia sp. Cha107L01]|uniref:hypothetical protein n=1 Tax=Pseudonocardia sp. Cha107L01 TaxID=3457576 RepID=UPI00403E394A